MDRSQRREFNQQLHRSAGSYELVFSPLILGAIAFLVDQWLGTTPILTVVATLIGLVGAVVKVYYGYAHEMDQHDADAPWSRRDG